PPVPDHHGLPGPPARRAGPGGHPPVPAGPHRRGVRDHPLRGRPQDGRGPMTGPYVIGCDVGSQGTNAALYAADGRLVASAYEPYDVAFPHPGWAEQDPRLWTAAVAAGVARRLAGGAGGAAAGKGVAFG